MPFKIIRNDITRVEADAIVNAANTTLKMGAGVCGAIFIAAGKEKLQKACDKIGFCGEGEAVITPAFNLRARYLIHTVGPVWLGGDANEQQLLRNAYDNSLRLAALKNCDSIAFPLISSGYFGYPRELALETAVSAISDFLKTHEMMIYLVVFDRESFMISEKRRHDVEKFIDDNYAAEKLLERRYNRAAEQKDEAYPEIAPIESRASYNDKVLAKNVPELRPRLEESFSRKLINLIEERGMTDPEAYRRANITRQHFNKIKNKRGYMPGKETVVAFAIALELDLEETSRLLRTAGLALSRSILFDVIIEYHIRNGIYDIFEINEILFSYDQPLLGA